MSSKNRTLPCGSCEHRHPSHTTTTNQKTNVEKAETVKKTQPLIGNGVKKTTVIQNKPINASQINLNERQTVTINSIGRARGHASMILNKVEPFQPVKIGERPPTIDEFKQKNNIKAEELKRQINIHIERDDQENDPKNTVNTNCLKKLFKKVKKLESQLAESDKQRTKLEMELSQYSGAAKNSKAQEETASKLQTDNYKLTVEVDLLRRALQDKEAALSSLRAMPPKEIIREVVIEKPVEVIVQVEKLVPGPERIVEKIVEVPKYIEVEKKIYVETEVPKEVIRTVEIPVPTIVEKPVYIERPVYIDRPYEVEKRVEVPYQVSVEVPVEVPVEYPIYVEKPVVEQEWTVRVQELEIEREHLISELRAQMSANAELSLRFDQLKRHLAVLQSYNVEKNMEFERMFQNSLEDIQFSSAERDASRDGYSRYSVIDGSKNKY